MVHGTTSGNYTLKFKVTEKGVNIPEHTVSAVVYITVKDIPEEAVRKSGSLRIRGTSIEAFITDHDTGRSPKEILHRHLAKILNTSSDNVDIFTVLTSIKDVLLVDVRFSAHGSPYYLPEKLNNAIIQHQEEVGVFK